jgi:hypothetical protein
MPAPGAGEVTVIVPVGSAQVVGSAGVATGAAGAVGAALITTLTVAGDVQPAAFVTVNVYVPVARPLIVVVAPEPVMLPGLIVQLPAGRPLRSTEPVGVVQVGCVGVPTTGAAGPAGAGFTVTCEAEEIQPAAFFTVTLYVPGATFVNTPVVFE